jgi:hypothetical protein
MLDSGQNSDGTIYIQIYWFAVCCDHKIKVTGPLGQAAHIQYQATK